MEKTKEQLAFDFLRKIYADQKWTNLGEFLKEHNELLSYEEYEVEFEKGMKLLDELNDQGKKGQDDYQEALTKLNTLVDNNVEYYCQYQEKLLGGYNPSY